MQAGSTLVKTPKGVEEIEKRTYKLSGRLRAVLFIIDGQRTVGDLMTQAGSLAEQTQGQLDELAAQGFIREIVPVVEEPEPPTPAPAPIQSTKPLVEERVVKPALVSNPLPATPPAPTVAPVAPPPEPKVEEPLDVVKDKVGKMLNETLGMRALFLGNQLSAINSRGALEDFLDDVARSMATSSGPKPAEQWRSSARKLAGFGK
jgi:hypothetical protein